MTEMLTYRNNKKCPGVTNNINECSIQINWIQNVSGSHSRELDMANLNGMQPLFMLLIINYSCAFPVSTCQKQETGRFLLIGLMMAFFYSSYRVSHDSVTVYNTRTLKLKQLNGIQQYFLLFLPSRQNVFVKIRLYFWSHWEGHIIITLLFITRSYKCLFGMVHNVAKTKQYT